jgi:hypothetical protein
VVQRFTLRDRLRALFVSDNTEIYFNVPQSRLKFWNLSYQSDYRIAHSLSINFNNCFSQIRKNVRLTVIGMGLYKYDFWLFFCPVYQSIIYVCVYIYIYIYARAARVCECVCLQLLTSFYLH